MKDAEQNAAYFEKFKPGQLIHIGPGSEETWNFEKYADNPQGMCDESTTQVTKVYRTQKRPVSFILSKKGS